MRLRCARKHSTVTCKYHPNDLLLSHVQLRPPKTLGLLLQLRSSSLCPGTRRQAAAKAISWSLSICKGNFFPTRWIFLRTLILSSSTTVSFGPLLIIGSLCMWLATDDSFLNSRRVNYVPLQTRLQPKSSLSRRTKASHWSMANCIMCGYV